MTRAFTKMHGLGNDFVVVDARTQAFALDDRLAAAIADRKRGVGCDQLIILEPAEEGADARMRIRNADGAEVEACGNASRCVASVLAQELGREEVEIETLGARLHATVHADGSVTVNMGPARLDWREIPLAQDCDTLHLGYSVGTLSDPVAVNMGNPHSVFFVENVETVPLSELGPKAEHHPLYPERCNVPVVQVLPDGSLRTRVWERGVGITQACGTGACAALVAAVRRGLSPHLNHVRLDGGPLKIAWLDNGEVLMTGPVATAFKGELDTEALLAHG